MNRIRELDPQTAASIKDAEFLKKVISETEVAARKCAFYAGMASEKDVKDSFKKEESRLRSAARVFEDLYTMLLKG